MAETLTFKHALTGEHVTIEGMILSDAQGLFISQSGRGNWSITHKATARVIAYGLTKANAIKLARVLNGLADWTQTDILAHLRQTDALGKVSEAIKQYGGLHG